MKKSPLSVSADQSHDNTSIPPSPSPTMIDSHVSENHTSTILPGSVVDGYIVYTRRKKARNSCHDDDDDSCENQKLKRLKTSSVEIGNVGDRVETRVSSSVVNSNNDSVQKEGGGNVVGKPLKWYSRSKTRFLDKVASVSESCQTENENAKSDDGKVKEESELSALTAPRSKMELKMSKKIVINKKPMTVKELFDTGLLDGVPVVYVGAKKTLVSILKYIYLFIYFDFHCACYF